MLRFCTRFLKDKSGLSAIEFALILPIMITSYFGVAEIGSFILADRKATAVAATAADLVAQSNQVSNATMADVMASLNTIILPFKANDLQIRISSVTANATGVTTIAWSDAVRTTPRGVGSSITMPAGLVPANQSVIMSEITFKYTSVAGMFLDNGITVTDTFYAKPRRTLAVQRVP